MRGLVVMGLLVLGCSSESSRRARAVIDGGGVDNVSDCVSDCDGDGFAAPEDCDDTDARAYPGGTFHDTSRVSGGFDFDCDGAETPVCERVYTGECFDTAGCADVVWVEVIPACGEEGVALIGWHLTDAGCNEPHGDRVTQARYCR